MERDGERCAPTAEVWIDRGASRRGEGAEDGAHCAEVSEGCVAYRRERGFLEDFGGSLSLLYVWYVRTYVCVCAGW